MRTRPVKRRPPGRGASAHAGAGEAQRAVYHAQGMDQGVAPARQAVLLSWDAIPLPGLRDWPEGVQADVEIVLDPLSAIRIHPLAVRHGDVQPGGILLSGLRCLRSRAADRALSGPRASVI